MCTIYWCYGSEKIIFSLGRTDGAFYFQSGSRHSINSAIEGAVTIASVYVNFRVHGPSTLTAYVQRVAPHCEWLSVMAVGPAGRDYNLCLYY